jgi:hypothetical protein
MDANVWFIWLYKQLSNTDWLSFLCVMKRSSGTPSVAQSSTVPHFDVVMMSSNQITEGGDAAEEVVVTNMVRSCKSSNMLIDCNSNHQQGWGLILWHAIDPLMIIDRECDLTCRLCTKPPWNRVQSTYRWGSIFVFESRAIDVSLRFHFCFRIACNRCIVEVQFLFSNCVQSTYCWGSIFVFELRAIDVSLRFHFLFWIACNWRIVEVQFLFLNRMQLTYHWGSTFVFKSHAIDISLRFHLRFWIACNRHIVEVLFSFSNCMQSTYPWGSIFCFLIRCNR